MENFDVDWGKNNNNNDNKSSDTLNMQVSLACKKDGRKVVYVTFSDATRFAEGEIPSCKITTNRGFTPEEVENLERYLKDNMDELNKTAAGIDPIRALFK